MELPSIIETKQRRIKEIKVKDIVADQGSPVPHQRLSPASPSTRSQSTRTFCDAAGHGAGPQLQLKLVVALLGRKGSNTPVQRYVFPCFGFGGVVMGGGGGVNWGGGGVGSGGGVPSISVLNPSESFQETIKNPAETDPVFEKNDG